MDPPYDRTSSRVKHRRGKIDTSVETLPPGRGSGRGEQQPPYKSALPRPRARSRRPSGCRAVRWTTVIASAIGRAARRRRLGLAAEPGGSCPIGAKQRSALVAALWRDPVDAHRERRRATQRATRRGRASSSPLDPSRRRVRSRSSALYLPREPCWIRTRPSAGLARTRAWRSPETRQKLSRAQCRGERAR